MSQTKRFPSEDLLRRIDARLKEFNATENDERAANAQDSDRESGTSEGRNGSVAGRGGRDKERAERNRENAQHSTGPNTPEGKQRSSQNSLKHGFYSDFEKLDPRDSPVYLVP